MSALDTLLKQSAPATVKPSVPTATGTPATPRPAVPQAINSLDSLITASRPTAASTAAVTKKTTVAKYPTVPVPAAPKPMPIIDKIGNPFKKVAKAVSNIKDDSVGGVVKNTIAGLPKAAWDFLGPGRIQAFLDTPEGQEAALNLTAKDFGDAVVPVLTEIAAAPVVDIAGIFTGPKVTNIPIPGGNLDVKRTKDGKLKPSAAVRSVPVQNIQKTASDAVANGSNVVEETIKAIPQAIFDALTLNLLGGGAKKASTGRAAEITVDELRTAHEFLGSPKTLEEARSNYLKIQQEYHPDKTGGNDAISKQANNAYQIIKERGIPGGAAAGTVDARPQPKPSVPRLLTEKAGVMDIDTLVKQSAPVGTRIGTAPVEAPVGGLPAVPKAETNAQPGAVSATTDPYTSIVDTYYGSTAPAAAPTKAAAYLEDLSFETGKTTEELLQDPAISAKFEELNNQVGDLTEQVHHADQALRDILDHLTLAEAGQRMLLQDRAQGQGTNNKMVSVPSTFPGWIPEGVRLRKYIDPVLESVKNLKDLKLPEGATATNKRLFINAIFDALDKKLGVDTSAQRSQLTQQYETKNTITPTAGFRRGVTGGEAKPGEQIAKVIKDTEGVESSIREDLAKDVPAKSLDELKARIDQLNKFGQARAILRRTGGITRKDALGQFHSEGARGDVRLRNEVVSTPEQYMSTLAHELGHALEYNIIGKTNVDTFRIFGDNLTDAQKAKIKAELTEITRRMVGEEAMKAKPVYYNKPTELFARFLERMFDNPADVTELAPTALELLEKNAINHPIIQEYLDAVFSKIDKGAPKFAFIRDMRQTYQKTLGNRVGDIVWKEEVNYRAMKERAKISIEKFITNKFKGIKDAPDALFRAAEAITFTENDAPNFGTRNFANAKTPEEVADLEANGWEVVKDEHGIKHDVIDGEEVTRYAKARYTAEEGKRLFEDLTPAGQKLIKEFTKRKEEAADLFNRDLIKQVYKVEGDIEGWVHHFFDEGAQSGTVGKAKKFKLKTAGSRKQRTGSEGYVEDFQKSLQKALTDLEGEKVWNDFIDRQFARVTKPIAKGEKPDIGWIEVQGSLKKGISTPQERTTVVIKDGKSIPVQSTRYQMPETIYQRYKLMREPAIEASKALRVMNSLNRYWRVNILFHPGSAATNFISGGIQYSTKILTDFYTEVLTGNIKFEKTRRNLFSMFTVMTPKGWQAAPDWLYGGDLSNFYGQFGTEKTPGMLDKGVDAYADKTLKFYGIVERYWKKVITTAENVGDLSKLEQVGRDGLKMPDDLERQMIDEINKEVDLFAYDYDNVPMWLENYQGNAMYQLFKPFLKYPYKYSKHVSNLVGSVFDRTRPWQERTAKILTIGTVMAMYAYYRDKRKKKQKTKEVPETAPPSVSTRGRLFIGTDAEGNEIFTRVAKYPFINLTETGAQFIDGNTNQGFQSLADMLGGIAPGGKMALLLLGIKNEFEQYTPVPVLIGQNIATFVPGTRILSDVARAFDPYQRKQKEFSQAFTSLLPLPSASEDLRTKLRGDKRSIQVPEEGTITGATGKRTTIDVDVRNFKEDILMGLFLGIYQSRIDPDVAEAFIIRGEENAEKKKKKDEKAAAAGQ